LACRNLLVDSGYVVKVSDLGLSRAVGGSSYYSGKGGKVAFKWTAPEAIQYQKFNTRTDVWSFGICLWEIVETGKQPYIGMSNREAANAVAEGLRLPKGVLCPNELYAIMQNCWNADPSLRPSFQQIHELLKNLSKAIEKPSFNVRNAEGEYYDDDDADRF